MECVTFTVLKEWLANKWKKGKKPISMVLPELLLWWKFSFFYLLLYFPLINNQAHKQKQPKTKNKQKKTKRKQQTTTQRKAQT